MPKTKFQSVIFTAVTAFMMVYSMTVYNIALESKVFTNKTFFAALKNMWLEYAIVFLCAYFISSRLAKKCAFKLVKPTDRSILIILSIQLFTVIFQVAFASILGTLKGYGLTAQLLPNYLITYCKNFIFALPLQLLAVGPLARKIFRALFRIKTV